MEFKEYAINDKGEKIKLVQFQVEKIPIEQYEIIHENSVIVCQDIIVEYNGGALLVIRKMPPARGLLWPIGGRVLRGFSMKNSLKKKVKEECNLEIKEFKLIDCCRLLQDTEPFGHKKGCDAIVFRYFAKGVGELKLNDLHTSPTITRPEEYTDEFRASLHPYVQDFMDMVMPLI